MCAVSPNSSQKITKNDIFRRTHPQNEATHKKQTWNEKNAWELNDGIQSKKKKSIFGCCLQKCLLFKKIISWQNLFLYYVIQFFQSSLFSLPYYSFIKFFTPYQLFHPFNLILLEPVSAFPLFSTHLHFYLNNIIKMAITLQIKHSLLPFLFFITLAYSKCSFRVLEDGKPLKVDEEPHLVQGLTQCVQYNGKLGCCNENNDNAQVTSYTQIDGVFGALGGGCDVCAINLKRFWCEYACSPRQADFAQVAEGFVPVPDPQKPDQEVMVQKVKLTIEAQTACDLFNSCERIPFVSSVSAMGTPAGFLNFQGHNAVDDAFQYIDTDFSYKKNDSLYFSDDHKETEPERSALDPCNHTQQDDELHGFPFTKNCSCNNCQSSCNSNDGFIYYDSGVFEGFDLWLVLGVWVGVIGVVGGVTLYRKKKEVKEKVN